MILLLFQLGPDRYALDASRVAEVLPWVGLKQIPQAAPGVAGVFNYHGAPVPVVDLSAMALGRPARRSLSTRLVLVRYQAESGTPRLIGLLVEQATETLRRNPGDFRPAGVSSPDAPYLGPVTNDERGIIQWVEVERLLKPEVRSQLWQQAEEVA
jgi:chemotaxis-related protein WspB